MNKTVMGTFTVRGVTKDLDNKSAEREASKITGINEDKLHAIKSDIHGHLFRVTSNKKDINEKLVYIREKFDKMVGDDIITLVNQFFIGKGERKIYDAGVISELLGERKFDNILSLLGEEAIDGIHNYLNDKRSA